MTFEPARAVECVKRVGRAWLARLKPSLGVDYGGPRLTAQQREVRDRVSHFIETRPRTIEEIFGPIPNELPLPGTEPGKADKTRYVSFDRSKRPYDLFEAVVERISPPLIRQGMALLENFILTTPDGTAFYPLSYHGDPEWPRQIELGAAELGLATAKIGVEQVPLTPSRRRRQAPAARV
jgi:hypothetical protein